MTYYESAEGRKITYARVLQELKTHGISEQEFLRDFEKRECYMAQRVLQWLGY
jgi:hypothetical protein